MLIIQQSLFNDRATRLCLVPVCLIRLRCRCYRCTDRIWWAVKTEGYFRMCSRNSTHDVATLLESMLMIIKFVHIIPNEANRESTNSQPKFACLWTRIIYLSTAFRTSYEYLRSSRRPAVMVDSGVSLYSRRFGQVLLKLDHKHCVDVDDNDNDNKSRNRDQNQYDLLRKYHAY